MFKGNLEVKLKDGLVVKSHALCLNINKDRRYSIYALVNGSYKKMVGNLLYSEVLRYLNVVRCALQ